MKRVTKNRKLSFEKLDLDKLYSLDEASELVKDITTTKFDASVDLAIRLGVDPKNANEMIRGVVSLPHGTGKSLKLLAIVSPDKEDEAKKAGADYVGLDEYIEKIKNGWVDVDVIVTMPSIMPKLGALGKVLGPKGLMPNPKDGTVTNNVKDAVQNAKKGQAMYRSDKAGIIHCSIGKVGFKGEEIEENFNALIDDIKKSRPSSTKGAFIKTITMSSTMGPGIKIKES